MQRSPLQAEKSSVQSEAHATLPPVNPRSEQGTPAPSHASSPVTPPLPQPAHLARSKVQSLLQDRLPVKPSEAQVVPFRSLPSHCSLPCALPSPQVGCAHCEVSKRHMLLQESEPPMNPSERQSLPAR